MWCILSHILFICPKNTNYGTESFPYLAPVLRGKRKSNLHLSAMLEKRQGPGEPLCTLDQLNSFGLPKPTFTMENGTLKATLYRVVNLAKQKVLKEDMPGLSHFKEHNRLKTSDYADCRFYCRKSNTTRITAYPTPAEHHVSNSFKNSASCFGEPIRISSCPFSRRCVGSGLIFIPSSGHWIATIVHSVF